LGFQAETLTPFAQSLALRVSRKRRRILLCWKLYRNEMQSRTPPTIIRAAKTGFSAFFLCPHSDEYFVSLGTLLIFALCLSVAASAPVQIQLGEVVGGLAQQPASNASFVSQAYLDVSGPFHYKLC
jgi:hypothetical protein